MERDRLLLTSAVVLWASQTLTWGSLACETTVEYGLPKLGYKSLKVEQMRAVESVLKGKDTFVGVLTSFGKSFQVHPASRSASAQNTEIY